MATIGPFPKGAEIQSGSQCESRICNTEKNGLKIGLHIILLEGLEVILEAKVKSFTVII